MFYISFSLMHQLSLCGILIIISNVPFLFHLTTLNKNIFIDVVETKKINFQNLLFVLAHPQKSTQIIFYNTKKINPLI